MEPSLRLLSLNFGLIGALIEVMPIERIITVRVDRKAQIDYIGILHPRNINLVADVRSTQHQGY